MWCLTIEFCRWIVDASFDCIQVLVVIGSGVLKFGRRCKILESGVGGWGASSRLVLSRLVSGAEVDSSIYTGNWVVV